MEPKTFLYMTSEELAAMTDWEMIEFADRVLGIFIEPGTPRSKINSKVVSAAVAVRDGI